MSLSSAMKRLDFELFAIVILLVIIFVALIAFVVLIANSDAATVDAVNTQTLTCHQIGGVAVCTLGNQPLTCSMVGTTIICQVPARGTDGY